MVANNGTTAASIIRNRRLRMTKERLYATRAAFVLDVLADAPAAGASVRPTAAQVETLALVGLRVDATGRVAGGQDELVAHVRREVAAATRTLARAAEVDVSRLAAEAEYRAPYRITVWQQYAAAGWYRSTFGPVEKMWLRGTYSFKHRDRFQGDVSRSIGEIVRKRHRAAAAELWRRGCEDDLLDLVLTKHLRKHRDALRRASARASLGGCTYGGIDPEVLGTDLFETHLWRGLATPRGAEVIGASLLRLGYSSDAPQADAGRNVGQRAAARRAAPGDRPA